MSQEAILALAAFFMFTTIALAAWLAIEKHRYRTLLDDYLKASKKSLDFIPLRAKIENLKEQLEKEKELRITTQKECIEALKQKQAKKSTKKGERK